MSLAPIALFVYNRPDHTKKTLEALRENVLASQSDLFVFEDGPKINASEEQRINISRVREIVNNQAWSKSITIIASDVNKGLANSIIKGVTDVVNKYGKVIVLEDDIITGKYFLTYMNESLNRYKNEKKVWHITGWCDPFKTSNNNSSWFYPVMDCWGWATWADRWSYYKKDCDYVKTSFNKVMIKKFNINGSDPGMWSQIERNADGTLNTWAIFWYAVIFLHDGLCLAPSKSLVKNSGFDNSGTNCGTNPFEEIDDSIDNKIITFPKKIKINRCLYFQLQGYMKMKNNITLKKSIKRIIKNILRPTYHFVKKINTGIITKGTVFMLHRVAPLESDRLFPNENMKLVPSVLEKQLSYFKKKYNCISTTEIPEYIKKIHLKKFVVFTMDDGYKDNFIYALPLFRKYNIPFTIFIAACFPEKTAKLWWYAIEDIILNHDFIKLSNGKQFFCNTKKAKEDTFMKIRSDILKLDQKNVITEIEKMFLPEYKIDWNKYAEDLTLSWDEIEELKKEKLVTLGAHTFNHYNLKQLKSKEEVVTEIQEGIDCLRKHGINPDVFAYPYGSPDEVSEREINILKENIDGIKIAFVAYGGDLTIKNKNQYKYPRRMLTNNFLEIK